MQIIDAEVKYDRTEEHTKDANREEYNHSPQGVVGNLEVVFAVQQETAQDTRRATDDVGNDIVNGCPLGKSREDEEVKGGGARANDSVENQIPEFCV